MNRTKYAAELQWWLYELEHAILPWYRGKCEKVWGHIIELHPERKFPTERQDAAATFSQAWSPYHGLLQIDGNARLGKVLDVGCGPLLPVRNLPCDECWGADPLIEDYIMSGFPMADRNVILLPHRCEDLWMVPSNHFDTVISNNSLDHVDDFEAVAAEMERVLKPGGLLRFRVHCHLPTPTEPISLTEERISEAFHRNITTLVTEHQETLTDTLWTT